MQKLAPVLMVQGTSSNVGKSLIVTALCRWFAQKGLRVAPFKAQNMALNAGVTIDGGEIGRAQMIQAEAAGVAATVHMNPLLLKPEGDRHSQLVLLGKAHGRYHFKKYHELKPQLREIILSSLKSLRLSHDIVIVEGAGSPAEMNLKDNDLVNMFVAKSVEAPVLLVGDIDRGGIFAALIGTLDLLDQDEKKLVAGFIINKFRGDPSLFDEGIRFIEERTKRRVFGVMPYLKEHGIAEEDSLGLDARPYRLRRNPHGIDIAIIRYPRMANYDEFDRLEAETNVHVAYITDPDEALDADLLIVPGSKATVSDLEWLRNRGFVHLIEERIKHQKPIMAICGGYQMMGISIEDPEAYESNLHSSLGLGLLPFRTYFRPVKLTRRRQVIWQHAPAFSPELKGTQACGYEIHMGEVIFDPDQLDLIQPLFKDASDAEHEGCLHPSGFLFGTLIHGLFDETYFRMTLINKLRQRKGLQALNRSAALGREEAFDSLAKSLEQNLDMPALLKLLHLTPERKNIVNSFSIPTLDKDLPRLLQDEINGKTKPLGSLGQLEHLALQIGHIQGTLKPKIQKPSLLIFAADHGVVKAGVSPYPQSVTASMLKNFAAGGAAINVLARQLGWELKLINSGTVEALDLPGVIDLRIGSGTHNFLEKPAMSQAELEQAIRSGAELIHELAKQGCNTVAFGEMGIGNSSSAALLIHCLADVPMAKAVSRGAGCNELQFKRKQDVLEQACQLHGRITEAFEALRVFGGFELAMIVGAALAAAEHKMLILVDGLIVSSAILVALKAYPSLQTYLVFAHCSAAQGHKEMLEYIGARPLLNLDLQLGEGSGAALALPLVQSAVAILQDMASFASAEIAEKIES